MFRKHNAARCPFGWHVFLWVVSSRNKSNNHFYRLPVMWFYEHYCDISCPDVFPSEVSGTEWLFLASLM
uniref:Uncharacterized protein n=1 Tax=Anguilla anguilla TaxID=7936 RepID=A0A0E9V7E4_ANGAN